MSVSVFTYAMSSSSEKVVYKILISKPNFKQLTDECSVEFKTLYGTKILLRMLSLSNRRTERKSAIGESTNN